MLSLTLASAAVPALTLAPWALFLRALITTSSATLASPAALALAPAPWAPLLRANYIAQPMIKKAAPDFRCCFFMFLPSGRPSTNMNIILNIILGGN